MLILLATYLNQTLGWGWTRLFQYITFRSIMGALTALMLCLLFGPFTIRRLRALKLRQAVRKDGPKTHLNKEGTSTMGGTLILAAILITTLLWGDLTNRYIWLLLIVMLLSGALGFYDDWKKIVYHDPHGISARFKMLAQSLIAIFVIIYLLSFTDHGQYNDYLIPFLKHFAYPLGVVGFIILTYFVIVGSSNGVNLTDGLDGLVALPVMLVSTGLAVFAYVSGHYEFAQYLRFTYIPEVGEIAIFCAIVGGACLGFLWWNAHPAAMFMGDVGALSLGATLGTIAVIVRQEIIFFIMGGLFAVEALSVMLQVGSYKLRRKRIFLMAPLHHHFEQRGWKESQVVVRFWIVTIMLVLVGLSSLKVH